MADNVTFQSSTLATPAAGVVVSTDEGAGGQVQRVKLCLSADGSETHISADANGLEIQGPGVAGTPAGGVITVQGVSGGTTLPVTEASAATIATNTGNAATSLAILDDWDESDRAKVNPIVGQAGLSAGAGAVDAATPRVTLASDDPGVALLGTIDADTGGILTAVQIMDDWDNGASDGASVSGDVAHDTADAGEPVKIGGKALDIGATATVAANDRTNLAALRNGQQVVIGGDTNVLSQNLQITDADGAQTDLAIISVSAGTAIVVTGLEVTADEANSVGVSCRIGFGTANTPAADAAKMLFFHPGMVPGAAYFKGNGGGIIGMGASDEDVRITCEDPVSGSISVTVTYFTVAIG